MRRRAALFRIVCLCATGAALAVPGWASAQAAGDAAPGFADDAALVAALRRGGYVLYLRHTATDFGERDAPAPDFADCATQRNLTDRGRADARAIAAALAVLRVPVGPVLASPYCRTMETGRLAFGAATPSPAVRGGPAQADADRYADLRALLGTPVARGTNLAIASHGNPFRAVAGPPHLAEGEIAVVEPLGGERFRVVARITVERWATLAAARGSLGSEL